MIRSLRVATLPAFIYNPPITMKPAITLFRKEFRQHWTLALGIVAACLLFQVTCIAATWYYHFGQQIDNELFIGSAFWLTVIYTGVAAALTYSTEHANKTFTFLRSLPVSLTTLAIGKIGWALCGTLLVLVGNFTVSVLLIVMLGQAAAFAELIQKNISNGDMWRVCGIALVQVFLWGLFWSTRCHRQMNAVLASYASPVLMFLTFVYFVGEVMKIRGQELSNLALYFSWVQIILVGFFAFWGVFRWFHYDTRRSLFARLFLDKHFVLIRYPKRVQSPFFALVHQHIRHASLTYHFGILCFIVWSLGCVCLCFFSEAAQRELFNRTTWFPIGYLVCIFGTFLFWGTIFGHDQRNDSYKFLTRLGIPPGTVWWSRMLPPLPLYVFGGLCFVVYFLVEQLSRNHPINLEALWHLGSMGLVAWLAPLAIGSLASISFRSQALAVVLTWGGTFALALWALNWLLRYDASPLWTTLQTCIALLIASRMRATYWLREMFTWRSRVIPLVPVFGVVLAIGTALCFMQMYSHHDQSHHDQSRDRKVANQISQPTGYGSEPNP